jgi:ABC-type uncharacterized transport system permease subunit
LFLPTQNRSLIFAIGVAVMILSPIAVTSMFMLISSTNLAEALYWIFWGGFSPTQIPEAMVRATPILITAFGLVPAYLARVWNIGSEGQILLGSIASAWIGLYLGGTGILGSLLSIAFGGFCGAIWALIPGLLRAFIGANEVFTTLMMNYLGSYLASYLLQGPLRNPSSLFPETATLSRDLWIEPLIPGTRVNAPMLLTAAIAGAASYILVVRSTIGVKLRIAGEGIEKAKYFGISAKKVIIATMAFSGFASGVAGSLEVLSIHHRALPSISQGYGYLAIPVAIISSYEPRLILPLSIYLGGIMNGVGILQMLFSIPSGISYAILGALLMACLPMVKRSGG